MDEEKKDLEKKEDTNPEEKKDKDKTPEEIEKEMNQMLEDLANQMGVNKNEIRVVSIKAPKRSFKQILFEALYYIIANSLLLIGLSGYIKWCSANWYQLLFYSLTFSGIELLFRNIIYILFKKTIIQTFGVVLVIAPVLAIAICVFLPFLAKPEYILRYIVVFVILLIVREFIKKYSLDFLRRHRRNRKKK